MVRKMAIPFQLKQMQSTSCQKIKYIDCLSDEWNRLSVSTRREGLGDGDGFRAQILQTCFSSCTQNKPDTCNYQKDIYKFGKRYSPCNVLNLDRPHLDYGNILWNKRYTMDGDKMERVQWRATRLYPELRGVTYQHRLQDLNLHSLHHRWRRCDMITVYKIIAGEGRIPGEMFFTREIHQSTRGPTFQLQRHRSRLDIRSKFFTQRIGAWIGPSSLKVWLKQNRFSPFRPNWTFIGGVKGSWRTVLSTCTNGMKSTGCP